MIPLKRFYMIRHGETEANAAQIMAGSLDSPLTLAGREQARAVQDIVKNLPEKPTIVVHSHLSRARDTARIINESLGLPMIEDADFAEIHAGDLEGVPWSQCGDFDDWRDMPNGERFEDFFERIKRAKRRILTSDTELPLIVSHGGVFRALAKLYGMETPSVRNCHLHEFTPADGKKSGLPWDVWHYDYDEAVIRSRAKLFYDED